MVAARLATRVSHRQLCRIAREMSLALEHRWSSQLGLGALALLCLEYAPLAFRVGPAVSALAWIAWIVAAFVAGRQERRRTLA
jgi:hypothetical protein